MSRPPAEGRGERGAPEPVSRWEWLTAAVGLTLVLAIVGYLAVQAVAGDASPPAFTVAVDAVTPVPGGHRVHVTVRNTGRRAGAGVVVQGMLATPGAPPESAELTLDYLAGGSRRRGALLFAADPRAGRLELRVLGYADP